LATEWQQTAEDIASHRAQAHALEIEAEAKRRLADEYDAAQERGEVGQSGSRSDLVSKGNEVKPTAAALGLSRKQILEAREVRDAERHQPGIVREVLDEALAGGEDGRGAGVPIGNAKATAAYLKVGNRRIFLIVGL
jgi:hypothetical protein